MNRVKHQNLVPIMRRRLVLYAHRCVGLTPRMWGQSQTSAHRAGMSVFDIATEGGWKDLKMVQRYTKARPFEELQRLPTPLSSVLGRAIS